MRRAADAARRRATSHATVSSHGRQAAERPRVRATRTQRVLARYGFRRGTRSIGAVPVSAHRRRELEALRDETRPQVERLLAQRGVDGARAEVAVDGSVADGLRRISADNQAELLIVGSRGRGTVLAALLGSTSHRSPATLRVRWSWWPPSTERRGDRHGRARSEPLSRAPAPRSDPARRESAPAPAGPAAPSPRRTSSGPRRAARRCAPRSGRGSRRGPK